MGKIILSPLKGGFATATDVKNPDPGKEKSWFQHFFKDPKQPLEHAIAFERQQLEELLKTDAEGVEVYALCFSKQLIENGAREERITLAAGAVKGITKTLDYTQFLLGNRFLMETNLLENRNDPCPTDWETTLFDPNLKLPKKLYIDWRNYRKQPAGPITYFSTAAFSKEKFQNLGKSTQVIFFTGFMNIMVTHTTGDPLINASAYWSADVENLVAFGANELGEFQTEAIFPNERWPEKWPPAGGS